MKYVDEYRDPAPVHAITGQIQATVTRPWVLMEVCGGQTHNIIRHGIDQLLPPELELVHGPGCPVCVTPLELIDQALVIARRPEVIFCSFGDMLRVPGSDTNLFRVKAEGGDVRVLYSPLDALEIAQQNPDREVVFFGVGFETTAPANAMAILQAHRLNITNFSVLVSHVRVPPAINSLLSAPAVRVQAFLAAGHVCAVMGYWEYHPLAERFGVPIVVTGFEPLDIVRGILMAVQQLETGRTQVENAYGRTVTEAGNTPAQQVIEQVFQECDRKWRGIGQIPGSGWCVRPDLPPLTPPSALKPARSPPTNHHYAMRARCCRGCSSRTSALFLAPPAPRARPLAHRWSPPKEPVPPTTTMAVSTLRQVTGDR